MHLPSIKGIIFDYGGTLDTHGTHWSHILRQGWQQAGLSVPDEVFRQAYVQGERAMAEIGAISHSDDFHAVLLKKSKAALGSMSNPSQYYIRPEEFRADDAAASIAHYCDAFAAKHTAESARLLKHLGEKYELCLVSNFYGNLPAVLEGYGLSRLFPHVIESAAVGVRKPDPRIFTIGALAMGLHPNEVLVVGDSLKNDILPAQSAGFPTLWLKGKGWDSSDDDVSQQRCISSLSRLADALP